MTRAGRGWGWEREGELLGRGAQHPSPGVAGCGVWGGGGGVGVGGGGREGVGTPWARRLAAVDIRAAAALHAAPQPSVSPPVSLTSPGGGDAIFPLNAAISLPAHITWQFSSCILSWRPHTTAVTRYGGGTLPLNASLILCQPDLPFTNNWKIFFKSVNFLNSLTHFTKKNHPPSFQPFLLSTFFDKFSY